MSCLSHRKYFNKIGNIIRSEILLGLYSIRVENDLEIKLYYTTSIHTERKKCI